MLRVLGLSLVLLIGAVACGDDDDADPPDKCDSGAKTCAGTGGGKPIAGSGGSKPIAGSGGAGMDAAVDASPPDSGKPDEIDGGDDDAGE
jgi:hypothetical protein